MRPNSTQGACPPQNRPGAPSVGFNNKRLRRLFRAVCANVSWKNIPTAMEEDGFTPKLSTCREYFMKFTNIPPGKVSNLEDKDAQRGRFIQMLDRVNRRQATGTPPIPQEAPESFKGAKTRSGIIGNAKENAEDIFQDQTGRRFKMATASRSPDNRESIMVNKGNNDATFKASGKKRPNLSYYDTEGVGGFPHKRPNDGRPLYSLGSIPTTLVSSPGLDQSRSDEAGDGPTLNTARSQPQKTVQDVEREMNLPPGSSDLWRSTRGSSIYSSSRPSTITSSISLVLDEQLPNFGQDDTSGQLSSSIALLFQLFENSRPDGEIKLDLRNLLLHAGDVTTRILVNARNNSRKLPLEFTIERGLYGSCLELLRFGADVGKRSSTGKSLSKLALRIQRDTGEDMPKYYAVGLCHKLLMDYSTVPNAKTIERRKRLGSIAKRDSLASIKESFTYPRSAPLPPVPHQNFSSKSTRATTTQLNLPKDHSFNPAPNYRPPIERQRNGVSQLVDHYDTLGSNEGYSSLGLEAEIYRQTGDENNVWVLPRTRSPAHIFESCMMPGALDDSATTHYLHGSSADNLVHPLQTGKYLELDGQVVIAFPVQAQVSDLQRLNSSSQFLYPSRAANSWILGPPFDPLTMDMATFQATGQDNPLLPYPQVPVTSGRNDILYENQGYNGQGDIALQEQQQQHQGPFQPLAGDATPNFPADGTFSCSRYVSSSPAPIQNEMEEFDFGFKFDNLENNEPAQY